MPSPKGWRVRNETEKNVVAGMSPEEARYAALRGFGREDRWRTAPLGASYLSNPRASSKSSPFRFGILETKSGHSFFNRLEEIQSPDNHYGCAPSPLAGEPWDADSLTWRGFWNSSAKLPKSDPTITVKAIHKESWGSSPIRNHFETRLISGNPGGPSS
jgi:hypothetical protein